MIIPLILTCLSTHISTGGKTGSFKQPHLSRKKIEGFATLEIERNQYGVPVITGDSPQDVFAGQGYACAQDRLWQMEMSRRSAEGALAEVLGPSALDSDKAMDATGYTKAEVEAEIQNQPASVREAMAAYCKGVNKAIAEREASDEGLPEGFKKYGFKPQEWTPYDCAAIAINLFKLFGTGGAGNLRDWALYQYLQMQPALKGRVLDVFNDIGWINDPKAPTTVSQSDDQATSPHPYFANPTDSDTLRQLKALPPTNIFQLLPAINVSLQQPAKLMAENMGVPFRTGSYCVVVGKNRSKNGQPILLSGPQMGLTNPSVCHEAALRASGLQVSGMDIPGVPGIAIGETPELAWGITSGVADLVDTFAYRSTSPGTYQYDGATKELQKVVFTIKVKGEDSVMVTQFRTNFGPVVLNSGSGVFALRSSYRNHELDMMTSLFGMYSAHSAEEASAAVENEPMSFNLFLADKHGNIAWRFCGKVPIRAKGLDPRLPTPASTENDWTGFIEPDQMPHTLNPKSGLIFNWNTKPAKWWSNGDTPAWGEVFRSSLIGKVLPQGKITPQDVEFVPWAIARLSPNYPEFAPFFPKDDRSELGAYNGWNLDGSFAANAWETVFEQLRKALFLKPIGNFLGTGLFDTVMQPTVMLHALQGKTRFNYLGKEPASGLIQSLLELQIGQDRYHSDAINYPGHSPVLYSDRGTYIQLAEIGPDGKWALETMLPPGESESGPHQFDQIDLARTWQFKPAWPPEKE